MNQVETIKIKLQNGDRIEELMISRQDAELLANQLLSVLKLQQRDDGTMPIEAMNVPKPDRSIFREKVTSIDEHLTTEIQPVPFIERIEYPEEKDGGGIFIHLKGFKYPAKGFPFPEACQATNVIKRLLMGQVRYLAKNPIALLPLLTKKGLSSWLREISSSGEIALASYILEPIRYQKSCREILKFSEIFLKELGVEKEVADNFSKTFETLLEYDNAYVFPIQDLANEASVEQLLNNPRKEFRRLVNILKERDHRLSMNVRFESINKIFSLMLFVPRFRRAYMKAIKSIDIDNIRMDDNDRYQVLRWTNYKFFGQSFEDRSKKFMEIHEGKYPPMFVVQTRSQ